MGGECIAVSYDDYGNGGDLVSSCCSDASDHTWDSGKN